MRLVKKIGLTLLAAVAVMACVDAALASAKTSTQICNTHTGLTCSSAATSVSATLAFGSVGELLAAIDVLCLGFSVWSTNFDVGALGNPQRLDATTMEFSNCGTGSTHSNCTISALELPNGNLLKTGLDEGVLEALNGTLWLICSNLGLNCLYDLEGAQFEVGGGHLTANETVVNELGGKFLCPDEGLLDGLLESPFNVYVLQ